jgi:hypothetical protein
LPGASREKNIRAGDLGEILAVELVEEELDYRVPIRKLCYKDCRTQAMRGDDFIAAKFDAHSKQLLLLKGESKSRAKLDKATLQQARNALDFWNGCCNPHSLNFVAHRMVDLEKDKELAQAFLKAAENPALDSACTAHMIFTLSGNQPHKALKENLMAADKNREQYVVNILIADYSDFIESVFASAQKCP